MISMPPSTYSYLEMFAARCIALIGPFGIAIITARMLGPEGQGRYYYLVTLATIGAQFASFGIHSSNTYLVAKDHALLAPILANSAWIAIAGGTAGAVAAVAFDLVVKNALHLEASLLFVPLLCPLTLFFLYLSNLAVAINRPTLFNALIILSGAVSLAAVAAAAYVSPTINVILGALVASSLLTCTVSWLLVADGRAIPWRFDRALFKQSMSFAWRAHVAALVGFFMARTSVVVLRHYGAFGDLGHWSIAAQISDALLLLPATISLLLFPSLVRADVERRWRDLKSMTLQLGAVMAIVCLTVAAMAHPFIDIVFGPAYAPAGGIVLALLPGVFFLAITSTISQFLTAFGIPLWQLAAWIAGWALQVGLSLLLFEKYGVLGLAWVQSGCAAFVCVLLFVTALEYIPGRASAASIPRNKDMAR
jgi:O-antigen/teichoic acid export membrane protein